MGQKMVDRWVHAPQAVPPSWKVFWGFMLWPIIFILVCALVMCAVGSAAAFDQLPGQFPEWADVDNKDITPNMDTFIIHIITTGVAEGTYPGIGNDFMFTKWKPGIGFYRLEGSGFYLGKDLIVTAAHVVVPKGVEMKDPERTYMRWVGPVTKVISTTIYVNEYPAELIYSDRDADVAVLKIMTSRHPFEAPYKITSSECLFTGWSVANMVMSRYEGELNENNHQVNYGTLAKHHAILIEGMEHELPWFSPNDVSLNLKIIPGDSGSPLFAFINGQPYIVGICRAGSPWYTYAARIDILIPYLQARGIEVYKEPMSW